MSIELEKYYEKKYFSAIRELCAFSVRNSDLMKQNDTMSDRILLDLDPLVLRQNKLIYELETEKVILHDKLEDLKLKHRNQSITIHAQFKMKHKLKADLNERDIKITGLLEDNSMLQKRINLQNSEVSTLRDCNGNQYNTILGMKERVMDALEFV